MKIILDTHILLWTLTGSRRMSAYGWLDELRPWGISPVSLLEMTFLAEIGRLEMDSGPLLEALAIDPRFQLDEPPLLALVRHAAELSWTRDPFDRLIAAHSEYRRVPLCTADEIVLRHHRWIPRQIRD